VHLLYWTLSFCLISVGLGSPLFAQANKPLLLPKVHQGDGWAMAAPSSWQIDEVIRPPTVLKLQGEGTRSFPDRDGTLEPLQIGIEVDRLDASVGRIEVVADFWKRHIKAEADYVLAGDVKQSEVTLAGGTPALLLMCQGTNEAGTRVTIYFAVVAAGKDRRVIVPTGHLTFGRASRSFVNKVGLIAMLQAHVRSVVVDDHKVDLEALTKTYGQYQWNLSKAVDRTLVARKNIQQRQLARASALLRETTQICPEFPAGHERLAWVHASSGDPKLLRPQFALEHAQIAVKQTDMLDLSALDTLALAYLKSRQIDKAREVYIKALAKDPDNESLQQRLEMYQ